MVNPTDRLDPDCVAGKHRACVGEAWDDVNDKPARCECPCHDDYDVVVDVVQSEPGPQLQAAFDQMTVEEAIHAMNHIHEWGDRRHVHPAPALRREPVMTTPTEDEARARIIAKLDRIPDSDAVTLDKSDVRALLASRVSTPPSEAVAQALAFAIKERDEIRGRYAQTGGSPARYLGYADACDDIIALLQGEATYPVPTVPVPPTDEDEAEALARAQWTDPVNVISWDELTEKAARDEGDYREIRDYTLAAARRGIAAGFRRQVPSTPEPEWEYGLTWEPYVTGDGQTPVSYSGCETEEGAWETGRRLAGGTQTPRVWRRPMRPAVQAVPAGPWEPVPTEGEA